MNHYTIEDFSIGDVVQVFQSFPKLKFHVFGVVSREVSEDGEDILVVMCQETGKVYNVSPKHVCDFFN